MATGDVHVHARTRAPLQDAFVAVRLHTTLDASEPQRRGNFSHVLASPAEMEARFAEYPEAVRETERLADRLRFDLRSDLGYRYPGAEDEQAMRKLAELCSKWMQVRYEHAPESIRERAQARLQEEMRIIESLRLPGFFLLHHEMLELAREVAVEVRGADSARALLPPGRGRGSSVSSIVCYLTGLSHVDPIANELLIGRFLNDELTSLPDIDLDFPRDIREKLIPRVHERFGHDRSALVAAFPTYRARGAIRELGKVLGLPPGEIERVARGSEGWDARDVGKDIENTGRRKLTGRWAWLARLAAEAYGLPRHLSQHSGGMIVATRPLIDCCPIVPAAMEGRQIAQWDKDSCADAGFLKIDLLGLGMLSAVERTVELIARTRGERIDLSRIPYDDPATYECIQDADTTGVFQIESRAQMQSLRRTRPANLKDLTVQVAIVRPGPIQGGAVNPYIERRQRLRVDPGYQVPYDHPSLEPVLSETLGTIIFQDQVLEVAIAFAGFTPRRGRGAAPGDEPQALGGGDPGLPRGLRAGRAAQARGRRRDGRARLLDGQGVLGVRLSQGARSRVRVARLPVDVAARALHPRALVLAAQRAADGLLSARRARPRGAATRDRGARPRRQRQRGRVRGRARRRGGEARRRAAGTGSDRPRLCPRHTDRRGHRAGDRPRARRAVQELLGARLARRLERVLARAAGLVWSVRLPRERGGIGSTRRALAARCDDPGHRVPGGTQLALPLDLPAPPKLRRLSEWESMLADYSTTGLTASSHPLALLRDRLPREAVTSRDLETLEHGSRVRVGGLVVARQRPGTASGVVFILLEDEFGTINLIVPPKIYERHRLTVRTEPLMLAAGKLERFAAAGGAINVLVDQVGSIDSPDQILADIKDFSMLDEQVRRGLAEQRAANGAAGDQGATAPDQGAEGSQAEDFRAVAPPVMSFASGRRR